MDNSGSGSGGDGNDRPTGRPPSSARGARPVRPGRGKRPSGRASGSYAPLSGRRPSDPSLKREPEAGAPQTPEPQRSDPALAPASHTSSPNLSAGASGTGRRPVEVKKSRRRSRLRNLASLAPLPGKIPERLGEGIEGIEKGIERGIEGIGKGVNATVDILKDPIGSVQQVVEALQAPRGLALGWAIALLLPLAIYLLDLGAGSVWQGADAKFALALEALSKGKLGFDEATRSLPPPRGSPLGLWQMTLTVRLLGINEATLRLLPVLAALGSAMCLLAISIDVGVGRHAGGLAGLVLLAMPLTYELSHRVLPDMLVAVASTGAVALVSHSLHGHKFDRHILPIHRDSDGPEPLPLRRLPMLFATLGIGVSALVDPRAGVIAIGFAVLDILISHRYLLRKRRVWLMLSGAILLTVLAALRQPTDPREWLRFPAPGVPLKTFLQIWHQGDSRFSRYIGRVVIVATGFGLLLGSLRRSSRSLLAWVLLAWAMTWFGEPSELPRGLGLVLPPLALCAAVGLQSPVRWLGALGGVITACALAGVVLVNIESERVLHHSDTIKILTQSQQHAPLGAKLCTVGIPPDVSRFYARRRIVQYASVDELAKALTPGQLFSCLVPKTMLEEVKRRFAPPVPTVVLVPEPLLRPGRRPTAKETREAREQREAKAREAKEATGLGSVLSTTLDIEEPPLDTLGPQVVLVSR